jgi:hypothetical protein
VLSNCWIEGAKEFRRRKRAWRAAGRPKHDRPWIKLAPSLSNPDWVLHAQVGGAGEPAVEFVPIHRRDVHPLLAWTRILFRGRHRPVDFPNTEPLDPDPREMT